MPDFQQTRSKRDPNRQYGEVGGTFENVGCAGEGMAGTQGKVEHLSEKQEVLATLMEDKMSMQKVAPEKYQEKIFEELKKELEEQKTKEALELVKRKHKLAR